MSRLSKITYALLAISFAGLGVTRWIADRYFGGEKQFMHTTAGNVLVWTFTFIWLVALLALLAGVDLARQAQHARIGNDGLPMVAMAIAYSVLCPR